MNENLESEQLVLIFSVNDVNALLNVLGELPFTKSVAFINNIHTQCVPQIEKINQKKEKKNEHKKRQQ